MSEDIYKLVTVLGEEHEVTKEIKIGRSKTCHIFLQDAEVSRHHATVWPEGEKCFIRDEDSSNGTFVNDKQIEGNHELKDGDKVRTGNMVILVAAPYTEAKTVTAPEPQPEPAPEPEPQPEPEPAIVPPPEPVYESPPMVDAPEQKNNLLQVGLAVGGCLLLLCLVVACVAAGYVYFTTGGFNF